jgi:hypothetical protein
VRGRNNRLDLRNRKTPGAAAPVGWERRTGTTDAAVRATGGTNALEALNTRWHKIALGVQSWHYLEHVPLLIQAISGGYLLGEQRPRQGNARKPASRPASPW